MKKFFLFAIAILLISCGEPSTEKSKAGIPQAEPKTANVSQPTADSSEAEPEIPFLTKEEEEEWWTVKKYKPPRVFFEDIYSICGSVCDDPVKQTTVYRAPFKVQMPKTEQIAVRLGSALPRQKIYYAHHPGKKFLLENLYKKFLEQREASGDSTFFTGTVVLELTIRANGSVENVKILESNTNNPAFDQELKDLVAIWEFSKSNGTTVVALPYAFLRTEYPIGFSEKM